MRISDWSSDVCSSDLASGELQRKLRSLKRLEAPEAMESSPDRTDEACWYRAVIFQNIAASVRPRFYWEIESFSGCGCNPDGPLTSIAGGVDQWRAVDRKRHLLTGSAYRLHLYTTEPGWKKIGRAHV